MSFIERKDIIWLFAVCVIVASTSYLSKHFGYLWLFWFLGGGVLGLAAQICYAEKPRRTVIRLIAAIVITGLAASLAVLLAGSVNL